MKVKLEFNLPEDRENFESTIEKLDEYSGARATLEFPLPEYQHDFDMATQGMKWYCIVWDLDQYLRNELKYRSNQYINSEYEMMERMRNKILLLMEEEGVRFE